MADESPHFIIIKRRSSHEEEHHGGAWKIAFADFMTAMMAFFLVLWIINATDKNTKTVIARYFNPVKIEEPARASRGIRTKDGDSSNQQPGTAEHADASGNEDPKEQKKKKRAPAKESTSKDRAQKGEHENRKDDVSGKKESSTSDGMDTRHLKREPEPASSSGPRADSNRSAAAVEQGLFSDPYATLDRIAGEAAPLSIGSAARRPSRAAEDSAGFQDPFRPPSLSDEISTETRAAAPEQGSGSDAKQGASAEADRAGTLSPMSPRTNDTNGPKADPILRDINTRIAALNLPHLPTVEARMSADGILISLTDNLQFSMFAVGSAEPRSEAIKAVTEIAAVLRKTQGRLVVRGHTDGRPYRSGVYDNWRLSSARAQMTYYMLIRGGILEARFDRIEGHADKSLRIPKAPLDPKNRRIEILLSAPE